MAQAESEMSRARHASDVESGAALVKSDFPKFTDDELETHFAAFKEYDVDSIGFITPDNLLAVMVAMEVEGITMESVTSMLKEVAILCEHDNDGKLSFRDYMKCMDYEARKDEYNDEIELKATEKLASVVSSTSGRGSAAEAADPNVPELVVPEILKRVSVEGLCDLIDAAETRELRQSFCELETAMADASLQDAAPPSTDEAQEPSDPQLMRGTSFKVFDSMAKKRIAAFQNVVSEKAEKEDVRISKPADADVDAFKDRMAKFKRIDAKLAGDAKTSKSNEKKASVLDEDIHKQTLKNKLSAFEEASKKKEVVTKKSWGTSGPGGQYTKKTVFVDGGDMKKPPPKKKISDW